MKTEQAKEWLKENDYPNAFLRTYGNQILYRTSDAMQAYADQQVKAERMKVRHYKLTLKHGDNDLSVDYFDDLTKLCVEVYHVGVENMSVIVNCVEVSQEEYNNNYLPI